MGDRANVVVYDPAEDAHPKEAVFLYSHWGGAELPSLLKAALDRQERWDDGQYLARIIFDAMTGGENGTTGFGIATRLSDNEHPLLVLDMRTQTVIEYPETDYTLVGFADLKNYKGVAFAKYNGKWRRGRS